MLALGLVLVGLAVFVGSPGSGAVPVRVMVVAPASGPGEGASSPSGNASVTANGYVVARTRASVCGQAAGADRRSQGERRDPTSVGARSSPGWRTPTTRPSRRRPRPALGTASAELVEARAERDVLAREAQRLRRIRARTPELVAEQEHGQRRRPGHPGRGTGASGRGPDPGGGGRPALRASQPREHRDPRALHRNRLRKEAEIGEVVAPSVGGGLTRGAVVTMADLTTLEVEVDVNEAYIARVRKVQPAKITLDAYPDTSFRGEVRQVVPTADRQRATVQVKVSIVDRDPRILPEMGARVDFLERYARGAAGDERAGRTASVPGPRAAVREIEAAERHLAGSGRPARVAPGAGRAGERRVPGDPLGAVRAASCCWWVGSMTRRRECG